MTNPDPTPDLSANLDVLLDGVPEALYHSGAWLPEPSLSVSGAKRLLKTSPARWRWEQENKPIKKPFEFGSAAHAKVLGVGVDVDVIPTDLLGKNGAISTDRAKAWVKERRDAGTIPLKAEEMAIIDAMAYALEHHEVAHRLLTSDGRAEVSVATRDPETGILLRSRLDWLTAYRDTPVIVDYKTTTDANPDEWKWAARRDQHPMGDSWYREVVDKVTGVSHGFLFIVQEKEPPYLVSVIQLDRLSRDYGTEDNRKARTIWLDCMTRDEWPAYPGITNITVTP